MNRQFPISVPGVDAPRTFGGWLANFLGAGRLDRKTAQCMRLEAMAAINEAQAKLAEARREASAVLDEYHEHKEMVYREHVAGFSGAYALIDKSARSSYVAQSESLKLAKALEAPEPPPLPSSITNIIGGLCLGGVLGGLLGYGLLAADVLGGAFAPAVIGVLAGVLSFALAMRAGAIAGAQHKDATRHFIAGELAQYMFEVDRKIHSLDKVAPSVVAMKIDIEHLDGTLTRMVEQVLDPLLGDSFNACDLLIAILDTPLLDGEGALMGGVIEKLQKQRVDVGEMQSKLTA
ncbi:hypothetical protein C2134_01540 [Chromobacterium sinusclupearum]|uniref:Uncharacterized protein n=1 Tax=Chromobacterium sinusclupearum TaxID=2077146 RepID=A0A2K4MTM6_9NEIS|nr:hypothetical protein [Chromobacterium sinusclupearum]POB00461.1 hypothetical protein C2134_01540 [Chromobacterium sinusclupearum]